MKRIMAAAALAAGMILSVYAEENAGNPFQSANEKFAKGQWRMANWRKAKIKVSQKDGKQVFKAEPDDPKIDGAVYCSDKIQVKPGQKIQFSITVSGQGSIRLAAWCYNAKGKFFKTIYNGRKLTEESKKISFIVPVPKDAAYVLPAFLLNGGTEAIVEALEYRIANPKSK